MKRFKALAICCFAVACATALLVLAGCSSQESYTPPEKTPTLASPVIGKEGTLRVGVNTQTAPLAGLPQGSTKIVGLDVDIAAALADSFGLKLEIVDVGTDPEAALKEGTVDIVMGMDKSDTDASFWKSETYLPSGVALFAASADASVPAKDSQPTVAAQVSSKSAWAVTNEFDKASVTSTDDLQGAFDALAAGQVQYVAADAIIGTYAAHTSGDTAQIVALMEQPSGYCVGVSDANTDLMQAVSDALATLTGNGMISVIEMKWFGSSLDLSATPLTEGATAPVKTASDVPETGAEGEGANAEGAEGEGEGSDVQAVLGEAGANAVQPGDLLV